MIGFTGQAPPRDLVMTSQGLRVQTRYIEIRLAGERYYAALYRFRRALFAIAIEQAADNRTHAAASLGIGRTHLQKLLGEHGFPRSPAAEKALASRRAAAAAPSTACCPHERKRHKAVSGRRTPGPCRARGCDCLSYRKGTR